MRKETQPCAAATHVVVRLAAEGPAWRTVVSLTSGSTVRVRLTA